MTIRHMKIFAAVYEHMNITRAASALHMTQPAVSRIIRELEDYYDVRFFERINHRIRPTDAGRLMYEHTAQLLHQFRNLESEIRDTDHSFTLDIGATYSLGSCILPLVIKRIKQIYPHATVRGHVYSAGNLQVLLQKGQLDFAMIEDQADDPALCSELFFEDEMTLVLPPDHPFTKKTSLTIKELENQTLLVREQGSIGRKRIDETFMRHGMTIKPLLESCSTRAIIQSVKMELGIAILPWYLVKNDLERGEIASRPIDNEPFTRRNYIVWHKDKIWSSPIRKAIEICREVAGELHNS